MKKDKALTLVELLIASLIFTVIMASIYASFRSGLFGYKNIGESLDNSQAAALILDNLDTELRNAFAYTQEDAKFNGSQERISFLTLIDSYDASREKFKTELALVSYKTEKGKLMRAYKKNQAALEEEAPASSEEMADNATIKFSYGYLGGESQQEMVFFESWPEQTAAASVKGLPQAVRIELIIKGREEVNFGRLVYLPLSG